MMQKTTPEETLLAVAEATVGGQCLLVGGPPGLVYPLVVTVDHVGASAYAGPDGETAHCATVRTDDGRSIAVRITGCLRPVA